MAVGARRRAADPRSVPPVTPAFSTALPSFQPCSQPHIRPLHNASPCVLTGVFAPSEREIGMRAAAPTIPAFRKAPGPLADNHSTGTHTRAHGSAKLDSADSEHVHCGVNSAPSPTGPDMVGPPAAAPPDHPGRRTATCFGGKGRRDRRGAAIAACRGTPQPGRCRSQAASVRLAACHRAGRRRGRAAGKYRPPQGGSRHGRYSGPWRSGRRAFATPTPGALFPAYPSSPHRPGARGVTESPFPARTARLSRQPVLPDGMGQRHASPASRTARTEAHSDKAQ